jgi:hypothetical protein
MNMDALHHTQTVNEAGLEMNIFSLSTWLFSRAS